MLISKNFFPKISVDSRSPRSFAAPRSPGTMAPAMVHALAPSQDAGQRMQHRGFSIRTRKFPILKAGPIEDMTARLGIAPPEMIFGDNVVAIDHEPSGWGISFNAFDALDRVDKTGKARLKVAYSREWQKNR